MSERERLLRERILEYLQDHGYAGTLDISCNLDASPTAVLRNLKRLQDEGKVQRGPLPPWTLIHK